MAIRRVEAFLQCRATVTPCRWPIAWTAQSVLTGRTIRSGFPCTIPAPSPLAALRIMSLACLRFAFLSAPTWPSWISARLNGLNVGAGGMVDIDASLLEANDRAKIAGENRRGDTERPRQRSIAQPLFLSSSKALTGIKTSPARFWAAS